MTADLQKKIDALIAAQKAADEAVAHANNLIRAQALEGEETLYLSTGDMRMPESVCLTGGDAVQVLKLVTTLLTQKLL